MNELQFNSVLRVFEAFSGVGMQRMSLEKLGVNYVSVGTSEIDIPAITSYAAIHDGLLENDDFEYPSKEEMAKYLEDRNIGLDFKTGKVKVPKSLKQLQTIYKAAVLSKCYGDISILNPHELPDMDLFTYSFPCTDLSVAGKQKGLDKSTRSGLLYECEKVIEAKRPKYLMLENVKPLVGKRFKPQFDEWIEYLDTLGYNSYWKVLNAKEFNVPQNRERVFCISILKEYDNGFEFPQEIGCSMKLRDVLEEFVEEKYYIDTDRAKQLIQKLYETEQLTAPVTPCDSTIMKPKALDIGNCITARYDAGIQNKPSIGIAVCESVPSENICIDDTVGFDGVRTYDGHTPTLRAERNGLKVIDQNRLGGMFDDEKGKHQAGSVWDVDGLAPTLDTMQGGYRQPCVVDDVKINVVGTLKGTGQPWDSRHESICRVYDQDGLSPTISTCQGGGTEPKVIVERKDNYLKQVGSLGGKHEQSNRVYSEDGICPTIMAEERKSCTGGYVPPKFLHKVDEYSTGAIRGRKVDGDTYDQQLELLDEEVTNTITTVQKDNVLVDPKIGSAKHLDQYRIRKLTPKECWRLMGISDECFEKAKQVNSNSQLYKQAGNGIVVNCLDGIFKNLFIN